MLKWDEKQGNCTKWSIQSQYKTRSEGVALQRVSDGLENKLMLDENFTFLPQFQIDKSVRESEFKSERERCASVQ